MVVVFGFRCLFLLIFKKFLNFLYRVYFLVFCFRDENIEFLSNGLLRFMEIVFI